MKLISMTDFVISQWDKDITREVFAQSMIRYATFLKQSLNLGMFVPCDLEGNVLEDPIPFECTDKEYSEWCKAKERVLFEGFRYENNKALCWNAFNGIDFQEYKTIESLICTYDLVLKPSAIKQLGI